MKTFKQFVRETTGFKLTRSLPGGGINVRDREHKETSSSSYGRDMNLTQKDPKNYQYDQDRISRVNTKFGPVTDYKDDNLDRTTTKSRDTQTKYKEKIKSISMVPGTERISSSKYFKTDDTTTKKGK